MTKLCARGKSAAKRKFKVYPSAYANAYASKICAGKIKDPSGTKRKDWGPKKAFLGGLMKTKDEKKEEIKKQETVFDKAKKDKKTKQQRLEEMKKELGMNKGGGADMSTIKKKKKKPAPGGGRERYEYMKNIQNPISEYSPDRKLKYTGAKVGMNVTAGGQSAMGRLEKSGMLKAYTGRAVRQPSETDKEFEMRHEYHTPFKKPQKTKGGGIAIKGTKFKGVF
jgi:hypothetical protein